MNEVKINDLELLKFCESEVSKKDITLDEFPHDRCVCFGAYKDDGTPQWSVVLYDFKGRHDCMVDIALNINGMFTPNLFKMIGRVIFNYAFNQANLNRCSIIIRKSNKASIKLAKAWGFKEEGLKRKGYREPIEDMLMLGILKSECKWI